MIHGTSLRRITITIPPEVLAEGEAAAVVAVLAADLSAALVTSDPDDLAHLLAHVGRGEQVELVVV